MLLSNRFEVKLQKRYHKVLELSVAFRDTFVFLGMSGVGKDVLVHCDLNGKILYEHVFTNAVDSLGMMTDREACVLDTRANLIYVFDLESHKRSDFPHHFQTEESDQSFIETFPQKKMLCVRQQGRYNDHRFKLTYYDYPLKTSEKPVAIYESQDNEWTHEYITKKGNNHSMLIWFKQRHDEEFEFKTFDIRDEPKGKMKTFKIKNTIGEAYNLNKVECALINIWEIKPNVFCLVCISNKTESKAVNSQGVVNNNFIYDAEKQIITQAKFYFDEKYNDFLIDIVNLGPYSMFRTFDFEDGRVLKSPVYYVNNESEQITATDSWQCTYKTKYFIPGFDNSMLIESEYQNGDVDEFVVYTKKVMDPKEIALHFLLHINEDFDDDLLKDAIELLESN